MIKKIKLARYGLVLVVILLFFGAGVTSSFGRAFIERDISQDINSSFIDLNPLGNILYVGGSGLGNYSNIQDAIDNATDGDTVFVYDDCSPYIENLIINKSINLIGENWETTVIDGNLKDSSTIIVNSNHVKIEGFTIFNSNSSGLRLMESEGCYISGNIIKLNNKYGLSLIDSSNNTISGNRISYNINGIFFLLASRNTISENKISNNEYGIRLYRKSRYNIIKSNIISNNKNGITLCGSMFPTFIFNILLDGSTHNTITKNNFLDNEKDAFFQNSRSNRWKRNYWNKSRILPKLIFGELYICRLQGTPPHTIDHFIPWIPKIEWRPALKQYDIGV